MGWAARLVPVLVLLAGWELAARWIGSRLFPPASTVIAAFDVRLARIAAIRFGEGIRPYPLLWCSLTQIASKPHCSAHTSCSMYVS